MKKKKGIVYLVGAGPGDAKLITVRGAGLLEGADAVIYDRLVNPELLELAKGAKKIYAGKDSDNEKAKGQDPQTRINRLLVRLAKEGKKVVRLKGGDPLIFGRGAEEASCLHAKGIRFEIVPGVSAGNAAPAYAGIPITDRHLSSLAVWVTAHEDPKKNSSIDWKKLAQIKGTLVCFMPVKGLSGIVKALLGGGKPAKTLITLIESGTLAHQRIIEGNLRTIVKKAKAAGLRSPALAVIGEVNRLRRKMAWFEKRPLSGKKVMMTRPREQAQHLKEALEKEGARVIDFPAIEIRPAEDPAALDQAIRKMHEFDWILFTSVYGARFFLERVGALGKDHRIFSHTKIAAIGESTGRALNEKGLRPDLVAYPHTSQGLVARLEEAGEIQGRRFLLPRTDIAPPALGENLKKLGGKVTQVVAYRTRPAMKGKAALETVLKKEKIDFVTFTSASTVKCFFDSLSSKGKSKIKSRLISIGPVTTQMLKEYGYEPYRQAREASVPELVKAMTHGR